MLRSIKELYGDKLGASDGEVGRVKDFYFDEQSWAVRYVVVDTGSWLPGRQVLLSPHAFTRPIQAGRVLQVHLTRKQIEDSPPIGDHPPVSRQYEEEYYRHYGWPYYWEGGALWGMGGFPILDYPPEAAPGGRAGPAGAPRIPEPRRCRADAHLRSTQAVKGYHIQAGADPHGHLSDFLMDAETWALSFLVIRIGHPFSGREVQVPVEKVGRISFPDSTILLKLSADELDHCPAHQPGPVGVAH